MQIVLETLLEGNSEKYHTWPFSAAHVLLVRIHPRQLGFERGHGRTYRPLQFALLNGSQPSKQRLFLLLQFSGTLMSLG